MVRASVRLHWPPASCQQSNPLQRPASLWTAAAPQHTWRWVKRGGVTPLWLAGIGGGGQGWWWGGKRVGWTVGRGEGCVEGAWGVEGGWWRRGGGGGREGSGRGGGALHPASTATPLRLPGGRLQPLNIHEGGGSISSGQFLQCCQTRFMTVDRTALA
jgi:hypothetical protein